MSSFAVFIAIGRPAWRCGHVTWLLFCWRNESSPNEINSTLHDQLSSSRETVPGLKHDTLVFCSDSGAITASREANCPKRTTARLKLLCLQDQGDGTNTGCWGFVFSHKSQHASRQDVGWQHYQHMPSTKVTYDKNSTRKQTRKWPVRAETSCSSPLRIWIPHQLQHHKIQNAILTQPERTGAQKFSHILADTLNL